MKQTKGRVTGVSRTLLGHGERGLRTRNSIRVNWESGEACDVFLQEGKQCGIRGDKSREAPVFQRHCGYVCRVRGGVRSVHVKDRINMRLI